MKIDIAAVLEGAFLPGVGSLLVEQVGSALVFVFVLASVAEAYNQFTATDDEGEPTAAEFQ